MPPTVQLKDSKSNSGLVPFYVTTCKSQFHPIFVCSLGSGKCSKKQLPHVLSFAPLDRVLKTPLIINSSIPRTKDQHKILKLHNYSVQNGHSASDILLLRVEREVSNDTWMV